MVGIYIGAEGLICRYLQYPIQWAVASLIQYRQHQQVFAARKEFHFRVMSDSAFPETVSGIYSLTLRLTRTICHRASQSAHPRMILRSQRLPDITPRDVGIRFRRCRELLLLSVSTVAGDNLRVVAPGYHERILISLMARCARPACNCRRHRHCSALLQESLSCAR